SKRGPCPFPVRRSRRHGYAAACTGDPGLRPVDLETPRRQCCGNCSDNACGVAGPRHAANRNALVIAANHVDRRPAKLLVVNAKGRMRHMARTALASLFSAGDVIVANDAATLPASLFGTHSPSGEAVEIRLAGWLSVGDPRQFV